MPPLGNRRNQQQNQRPQSPFGRFARGPVLYVIVLLVLAYILLTTLAGAKTIKELTLTDYLQRIDSGQVATAEILNRDRRVQTKLKDDTVYLGALPTAYANDSTNLLTHAKVPVK